MSSIDAPFAATTIPLEIPVGRSETAYEGFLFRLGELTQRFFGAAEPVLTRWKLFASNILNTKLPVIENKLAEKRSEDKIEKSIQQIMGALRSGSRKAVLAVLGALNMPIPAQLMDLKGADGQTVSEIAKQGNLKDEGYGNAPVLPPMIADIAASGQKKPGEGVKEIAAATVVHATTLADTNLVATVAAPAAAATATVVVDALQGKKIDATEEPAATVTAPADEAIKTIFASPTIRLTPRHTHNALENSIIPTIEIAEVATAAATVIIPALAAAAATTIVPSVRRAATTIAGVQNPMTVTFSAASFKPKPPAATLNYAFAA